MIRKILPLAKKYSFFGILSALSIAIEVAIEVRIPFLLSKIINNGIMGNDFELVKTLDTRTEKLIEKGMDKLMEGKTVFVIAHRLSTVRSSKAILVLENGKITERGSHEELLALKGKYYQFYTGSLELS